MASHKRRGHLDKSTRDHLTGIEAALQIIHPESRREDEFTAGELHSKVSKKGKKCSYESVRHKLDRMVQSGQCKKRKVNLGGYMTNLYRMVSPDSAPHGS